MRKVSKLYTTMQCARCRGFFYAESTTRPFFFCSERCEQSGPDQEAVPVATPSGYRRVAFAHYAPRCDACQWDAHPEVLEVHHKDRNRANNHPTNLRILCPTCHDVEHLRTNSGKWARRRITAE
jgi:5-methylcytosine-specific restriction endonuclease McrA